MCTFPEKKQGISFTKMEEKTKGKAGYKSHMGSN